MRFDLTDLRLFLHIVEAENITHGAERAGLALPSASARIRGMEEVSGVLLLDRNPRGVRVTPAGEALAHHARIVLGQLEQMRGDLRQYAQGLRGHVRVLSITAALAYLPAALQRFLAAHPAIDIDLEEKPSPEIVAAIAGGLADLGIAADTADMGSLETRPFVRDRLVLIASHGHPLGARESVALRDVLDEPFIGLPHGSALQEHLTGHAARERRPFKLRVRLGSFEAICAMAEAGVGLAIVPEAAARKYQHGTTVRMVALSDSWARRGLLICTRRFDALPEHARQLIDVLMDRSAGAQA
jgi:DNA-binding transcriptional LysR family regulator